MKRELYCSFIKGKRTAVFLSIIYLLLFTGCASVPFKAEDYAKTKIAVVYQNYQIVEYSEFDSLFRSEKIDAQVGNVDTMLLEKDEELYVYFKTRIISLFNEAKIPGFKFTKNDVFYQRQIPVKDKNAGFLKAGHTDFNYLKNMGYTHVLYIRLTYNLEKEAVHMGIVARIWTVKDLIEQVLPDGPEIAVYLSFPMTYGRHYCPSVHFADNKESEYYKPEQITSGNPSLYYRIVKASIYFYLSNCVERMKTGVTLKDRGVIRRYYIKEFLEQFENKM